MTTMPQWTMESFIALSKAFQAALTMQGAFEFEAAQNPPADVWSLVRRGSDAVRADRPYYRQGKGSRSTSVSSVFRFQGLDSIWKTTCFNRFQGAKKYAFPIVQSNRNSEGWICWICQIEIRCFCSASESANHSLWGTDFVTCFCAQCPRCAHHPPGGPPLKRKRERRHKIWLDDHVRTRPNPLPRSEAETPGV